MVPCLEQGRMQRRAVGVDEPLLGVGLRVACVKKAECPGREHCAERAVVDAACLVGAALQNLQNAAAKRVILPCFRRDDFRAVVCGGRGQAARPVGSIVGAGLPRGQQQRFYRKILQNGAGVAGVVGVGMGQHKVIEGAHIEGVQVVKQCVLSLGRAGVDQAVRAVLIKQHGVALPDVQHIDGGGTGGGLRCAFLGL